jgi:uncharacterized membrane protein YhaH (DUF805 family)
MNYFLKVLQQYADFEGRARRAEYWYFTLFSVLISIGLGLVGAMMKTDVIGNIYSLASIAVGIRRMHDVDKSGWYILIPIYNLILACTEGTRGPNQYGSDPKDPDSTAMVGGDSGLLDDRL